MADAVTLWASGSSNRGQLGIDSLDDARAWTAVALPRGALSEPVLRRDGLRIAAGATHSVLAVGDRHFACGRPLRPGEADQATFTERRGLGELGLDQERLAELGIGPDAAVVVVGCSWECTVFVVRSGDDRLLSLDERGQLAELRRPDGVSSGAVDRLVCGPRHSVALIGDVLIGWGAHRYGQLGRADRACIPARATD